MTSEENDKEDDKQGESHDLEVNEDAAQTELDMESQVDKNRRMRDKLLVSMTFRHCSMICLNLIGFTKNSFQ